MRNKMQSLCKNLRMLCAIDLEQRGLAFHSPPERAIARPADARQIMHAAGPEHAALIIALS